MEIIFIRHGEPDYAPCDERGFIGHGRDLAPLTKLGTEQAEIVATNSILMNSEIIISSPYTRALQTAAIISKQTGIALTVEVDLREWQPDKSFQYKTSEESFALHQDFWNCKGTYPDDQPKKWEKMEEIIARVDPVIHAYYELGYKKVIIVAHGGVIRRFTGDANVHYCTPYLVEYNGSYDYFQWV